MLHQMNSWMWKKTKSRVTSFHLFNTDWLQMPWSGPPLLTCRHVLLISAFIGSTCRDELYSRWRRWRIVLCTTLVGVIIHICHRHAAPTQAQVRLHWTAWRSDLSSVNYRRSCLSCCWSKGVEWPAKRCYVGLVAVGVQEQAEDILAPLLLQNCLTLNHISFS